MLQVIGGSALLILVYATGWFAVALRVGRNDVADVAWGLGYVLLCGYLVLTQRVDTRDPLVYGLVTVWGLRLSAHIHVRNRGKEEDFRYRRWREEWGAGVRGLPRADQRLLPPAAARGRVARPRGAGAPRPLKHSLPSAFPAQRVSPLAEVSWNVFAS